MTELTTAFQNLLSLSERMVLLAREQEWNALVDLEKERSRIASRLPAKLPALPKAEVRVVTQAIKRILECNESIHGHVGPWMEHVGTLLAALAKKA